MIKNTYQYHKVDLRKNRNLYQYSRYFGLRFIKDYFKARRELLKDYEEKNFSIKKKITNFSEIKTLCRKFEIKKKLFKNKNNTREYSIDDYIISSQKIIVYLFSEKNYSILSTLLKMNDLILYMYFKNNNEKYLKRLKRIIHCECKIIKETIYEQKIR